MIAEPEQPVEDPIASKRETFRTGQAQGQIAVRSGARSNPGRRRTITAQREATLDAGSPRPPTKYCYRPVCRVAGACRARRRGTSAGGFESALAELRVDPLAAQTQQDGPLSEPEGCGGLLAKDEQASLAEAAAMVARSRMPIARLPARSDFEKKRSVDPGQHLPRLVASPVGAGHGVSLCLDRQVEGECGPARSEGTVR